jgi:hypothetical protein
VALSLPFVALLIVVPDLRVWVEFHAVAQVVFCVEYLGPVSEARA